MTDIVEKLKSWDRCYPGNINIEDAVEEIDAEITRLREENEKLRAAFRVNMLRAFPNMSHEEIDAEIDAAILGEK
jgi:hypothetical protein